MFILSLKSLFNENTVLRGDLDVTEMIHAQNENSLIKKPTLFLSFEGLRPNSNYRLLIYLKKVLNKNHRSLLNPQVQIILNQTVSTLLKEQSSDSKLYEDYYDEEDDDEYLDDVSYEDNNSDQNDRIISCDLYRSQIKTSKATSNSLFSLNANRKKFINQFLTIN